MSALLCVGLALGSVGSVSSFREALDAVREAGPQRRSAIAYLNAKGRKGLWALNGAAKKVDGPEQVRLVAAMGELSTEGAEWALRSAWQDEDPDAKEGALLGFGRLGGALAEGVLIEALQGDPVYLQVAAEAAAQQAEPMRSALMELIRDPADRAAGLTVALVARDPVLTSTGLTLGLNDQRPQVQVLAIRLAAQAKRSGSAASVAGLIASPHPEVARAAVEATAALGARGSRDRLSEVLAGGDHDPQVEDLAFDALRREKAWEDLFTGLGRRPDGPQYVARRLRMAEPAEGEATAWVEGLDRTSVRERRVAEGAVTGLGSRARPALVAALGAPSPSLRRRALAELRRGEDPETLERELEAALRTGEDEVRAGAAGALIAIEGLPAASGRLELLRDESGRVQRAAARALAQLPSESMDAQLSAMVPELSVEAQSGLLEGARVRKDPAFVELLAQRLLVSEDPGVRRLALESLHPARTEPTLRQLVDHVRTAPLDEKILAMEAIGASSLPSAGDLLVSLVTDVDPEVRKAALAYVERL